MQQKQTKAYNILIYSNNFIKYHDIKKQWKRE